MRRRHLPNVQVPKQPDFHRYPRRIQQLKLLPIPPKHTNKKHTHTPTPNITHTPKTHTPTTPHTHNTPQTPKTKSILKTPNTPKSNKSVGFNLQNREKIVKPAKYFGPTPPTE